jgi:DNA-3-methyladenine glycosylase II
MTALIETEADISAAAADLAARCEVGRRMLAETGLPPLRRSAGGFEGLLKIIVSQQVSVASANAIWAKVKATFPGLLPTQFLTHDDSMMRAAGLSGPKMRTMRAIAEAVQDGTLDLPGLAHQDADAAKSAMVKVKGIGPWTADIYLMFCLGHADAFAPGDLALQEAIRIAFRLDERPTERETLLIAERWRPNRATAARLLWAYYKVVKDREGVT